MFSIANLITSCNLFLGSCAIVLVLNNQFLPAIYCILLALVADFMDGFVARKLNQTSDIGRQLDSLGDVISFGLFPACVVFQILRQSEGESSILPYFAFILAVMSAFRLARFNVNSDHSPADFQGLPTPAMGLFFTGLLSYFINPMPWQDRILQPPVLVFLIILFSYLMVSNWTILKINPKPFWIKKHGLLLLVYLICLILSFKLGLLAFSLVVIIHIVYSILYKLFYEKLSGKN